MISIEKNSLCALLRISKKIAPFVYSHKRVSHQKLIYSSSTTESFDPKSIFLNSKILNRLNAADLHGIDSGSRQPVQRDRMLHAGKCIFRFSICYRNSPLRGSPLHSRMQWDDSFYRANDRQMLSFSASLVRWRCQVRAFIRAVLTGWSRTSMFCFSLVDWRR